MILYILLNPQDERLNLVGSVSIWRRAGGVGQVTVNDETGAPIGIQYRTSARTQGTVPCVLKS